MHKRAVAVRSGWRGAEGGLSGIRGAPGLLKTPRGGRLEVRLERGMDGKACKGGGEEGEMLELSSSVGFVAAACWTHDVCEATAAAEAHRSVTRRDT